MSEQKIAAECWTCGHCPTGEHGLNVSCIKARHFLPKRFILEPTIPTVGRHAGQDVRPVARKDGDK